MDTPAADRPDPVALLQEQDATREPDLVPIRHGRMLVSPFTFYRGAAKIMAADLKDTPTAGLQALSKLGELVDGQYRIVSQPPIVVPARELEVTYGLSATRPSS